MPQRKQVQEEISKDEIYAPKPDYLRVSYLQPHWTRRKEILAVHPEVQSLMHPDLSTSIWVIISVISLTYLLINIKEGAIPSR